MTSTFENNITYFLFDQGVWIARKWSTLSSLNSTARSSSAVTVILPIGFAVTMSRIGANWAQKRRRSTSSKTRVKVAEAKNVILSLALQSCPELQFHIQWTSLIKHILTTTQLVLEFRWQSTTTKTPMMTSNTWMRSGPLRNWCISMVVAQMKISSTIV